MGDQRTEFRDGYLPEGVRSFAPIEYMTLDRAHPRLVPGQVLNDAEARSHGDAALIPVHSEWMSRSAVGGFFRRDWGKGWPTPWPRIGAFCPMVIWLKPGTTKIHWRLGLRIAARSKPEGIIRMICDTTQPGVPLSLTKLDGVPDAVDLSAFAEQAGGLTFSVGGTYLARTSQEGFYGFALYGNGQGAYVDWSAVSQTP